MGKEKIIEAAKELFAQKGYEGAVLSQIAAAAGIKKPSLYAHFKNKEDLFLTVFERVLEGKIAEIEKAKNQGGGLPAYQQILILFETHAAIPSDSNELFWARNKIFLPLDLQEKVRTDFAVYENKCSKFLNSLFLEINSAAYNSEVAEDFANMFYLIIDGLLLEYYYYPKEIYAKRKQTGWRMLCSHFDLKEEIE